MPTRRGRVVVFEASAAFRRGLDGGGVNGPDTEQPHVFSFEKCRPVFRQSCKPDWEPVEPSSDGILFRLC